MQDAKEEASRAKATKIATCFRVLFFIVKCFGYVMKIGFPKTFLHNEGIGAVISVVPFNFAAKITDFQVQGSMKPET